MYGIKAFSLIELMVVIAIVAVLAAVAVPQYKSYIVKSKTAAIIPTLDNLTERAVQFSSKHGFFPRAYDLGLSTTIDSDAVDNPSEFLPSEYFGAPNTGIFMVDGGPITRCGASGTVYISVDAYYLGIPDVSSPGNTTFIMVTLLYNIDGVIQKYHTYYSFRSYGDSVPGDFVSGWSNYYIDSAMTLNTSVDNAVNALAASATCM